MKMIDEQQLKDQLKMGIDSLNEEQLLKFIELIRAIAKLQGEKEHD